MSNIIANKDMLRIIPARSKRSRKGDNGVVLVIGGSKLYHGAPLLTSLSAFRSGIDLVYLAVPKSISIPIRAYNPSIIVLPLPDDKLTSGSVNRLLAMIPKHIDAAAIGMGLSTTKEGLLKLIKELHNMKIRLVLDASSLIPDVLQYISKDDILTPHVGEFKRISGIELPDENEVRIDIIKRFASEHGTTILLKSFVDIISDGESVGLNFTHNCSMTVGGTGDILAGITVGLLAKGLRTFDAALLAAFINGSAGNLAYERLGLHIMPTDVIENIPIVMKEYDTITD